MFSHKYSDKDKNIFVLLLYYDIDHACWPISSMIAFTSHGNKSLRSQIPQEIWDTAEIRVWIIENLLAETYAELYLCKKDCISDQAFSEINKWQ